MAIDPDRFAKAWAQQLAAQAQRAQQRRERARLRDQQRTEAWNKRDLKRSIADAATAHYETTKEADDGAQK